MNTISSENDLAAKKQRLREIILEAAGKDHLVIVAFSGGVDSSLLLWESVQVLGNKRVIAATATSPTSFPEEEQAAARFAQQLNVEHMVISTRECFDPSFMRNSDDRCYVCKRIRYDLMNSMGQSRGAMVVDGTQADDDPADRPGMRALEELEIRTPLAEAGIAKEEVRDLLRKAGFPDLAEKHAQPCLATRFPTGTPITLDALEMVREGESFLKQFGLKTLRLRHHYPIARIVTDRAGISLILGQEGLRERIAEGLRGIGYEHVTLDLEEYAKQRR